MTKFKVGDRVKVVNVTRNEDKIFLNNIYTIVKVDSFWGFPYHLDKTNYSSGDSKLWKDEELELVKQKQFIKSDLKDRFIVKIRDGEEYIINLQQFKMFKLKNGIQKEDFIHLENYNNNLTNKYVYIYDIIEIYKPEYKTIWIRPEEVKPEPKGLTVDEISKLLGYDIKIIGGNNE